MTAIETTARALVNQVNERGYVAHYYPRKREIALNGFPAQPAEAMFPTLRALLSCPVNAPPSSAPANVVCPTCDGSGYVPEE